MITNIYARNETETHRFQFQKTKRYLFVPRLSDRKEEPVNLALKYLFYENINLKIF